MESLRNADRKVPCRLVRSSARWALSLSLLLLAWIRLAGQAPPNAASKVWVADLGDGRYRNPVLYADYSDPDVTRVGNKFYLVSSSFDQVPGLPLLESSDLVNWRLIGHALAEQLPAEVYSSVRHGSGVWAPAIRFHAGQFYIFYPDPDFGIYVTKTKNILGPWSAPKLIRATKGWIDPCPLWDDDGNAYLINAMAGSRSGLRNVLILSRMSSDGEQLLDSGALVVDGHGKDVTLEGPKLYKRGGYYYIFAPAGGVKPGYQLVFRSKSVYGPYERRVVLAQGKTPTNGPHQGAWVTTAGGEDWFLHFQDRGPYGRVVLLEPMRWKNDWPLIGTNQDSNGVGEPVDSWQKPSSLARHLIETPPDSDEFNGPELGAQWQWQANPLPGWAFPSQALGVLRLIEVPADAAHGTRIWDIPNVVSQKTPGPAFTATVKMTATNFHEGDRAGFVMLGKSYAYVAIRSTVKGLSLVYGTCQNADRGGQESETVIGALESPAVYIRTRMDSGAHVFFEYSTDDRTYRSAGPVFNAEAGIWIGAKLGLFAQGYALTGDNGYLDVDWFRLTR